MPVIFGRATIALGIGPHSSYFSYAVIETEQGVGLLLFADFLAWKSNEEDATLSQFVKVRGDMRRSSRSSTLKLYYCHRSGRYIGKSGGRRHLKVQGSCKVNRWCPAAIFAKIVASGMLQGV